MLTPQQATFTDLPCIPVRGSLLLQAFNPTAHLSESSQFLNQAPPRKQQLRLPALLTPHLGHVIDGAVVEVAAVVAVAAVVTASAVTGSQ